ncbi:MAG: M28 family peptidase [Planctomycetaceae bacterium]
MTALAILLTALPLQAGDVPALTADETAAMSVITEQNVLGTVSFLASDEMAGRDTPSPELNIASAYVASRFRAAGLEGLGPAGSFYQETTLDTFKAPTGATVQAADAKLKCYGALYGGREEFTFEGDIPKVVNNKKVNGPVWMPAPQLRPGMPPSFLPRLVSRSALAFKRLGATALVVVVEPESPLVGAVAQYQQQPTMRSAPLPIVVVSAEPKGVCKVSVPARVAEPAVVRNVIAVRRGSDPEMAKQAIVITAHLDHIGRAKGEDKVNNGADDDATGVTAVLTLAEAYAAMKEAPKRSVIFMTFWGEEKGLLGSKYFVESPLWPLENIVANLNFEMLGRPEEGADHKAWMSGWKKSDLGELMAKGAARAGITVFEHPRHSAPLYRASDNFSFVRAGVIGHSFSAGSLHQDYHQPSDEWEKLKIPHMTKVIQGLFAGSLPIAHGEMTPQKK